MESKKQRIEKKRKRDKISLVIMLFLFSVISFYTSYTGLLKLSGVSNNNYVLQVFMAVLVGVLQFTLVFSINAFYIQDMFKKYWIKSIALLLTYIITMVLSVTFSFSYWYEEFSAEDYAKRSSALQLNKVKKSLLEAKQSFIVMENSLTMLSEYSQTESNKERRYGGTCNPSVGSGEGVYTWLRADDAKYTKSYSEDIHKLKNELDDEINQVSRYLETFNPKGNVSQFNREVNDKINEINIKYFNSQTLKSLESMLEERSGKSRNHISVFNKKTASTTMQSCMDRDFTIGAKRVIHRVRALKSIKTLNFFDMSDTKKLFGRTALVLKALVSPSDKIKNTDEMSEANDITYDDIYAVSAGFVIDFLILLITLYGKEPKEDLVPIETVKDILNGKYPNEVLGSLKLFIAELNSSYLIAVPNDVDDALDNKKVANLKLLMLYMQQQKLAKLYINDRKSERFNKYFNKHLKETYAGHTFRVYRIKKKKFNQFILQNIVEGATHV
ncbi:MAG: Unknown protein [uncultured Sulfurovum sp.]|uniref:Uncharacterized protein n=1 Tax=uncultured Sulfurovum sp. TaxID=269237 RepID=A0A6S6SH68_9BACT|nr:MAG: Unknown protein [uncultured Sulfurovum sp.]